MPDVVRRRIHCFTRTTRTPIVAMGTIGLVVGACVIVSSSVGCNAPKQQLATEAEQEPNPAALHTKAVGSEASNPYFALRVLNTKVCTVPRDRTPAPGIKKLAVEVELQGLASTEVPANPFYATLTDDKGQKFESTALGCKPMLGGPPLVHEASTRGWVTFDVPEGSMGQTIGYQPALVGVRTPRVELELR